MIDAHIVSSHQQFLMITKTLWGICAIVHEPITNPTLTPAEFWRNVFSKSWWCTDLNSAVCQKIRAACTCSDDAIINYKKFKCNFSFWASASQVRTWLVSPGTAYACRGVCTMLLRCQQTSSAHHAPLDSRQAYSRSKPDQTCSAFGSSCHTSTSTTLLIAIQIICADTYIHILHLKYWN